MNDVTDAFARACVCRVCIQALRAGMAVQTIKKGMMRVCVRAGVGVGVVDGGERGRRSGRLENHRRGAGFFSFLCERARWALRCARFRTDVMYHACA